MRATGENTKAGAFNAVAKHYLADLENKRCIAPELDDELADQLSTPWLPIERETRGGNEEK
jgi:hypothetical protein